MLDAHRIERIRRSQGDTRSLDRIKAHYDIEVVLAQRLRDARKEDRRLLYTQVYDELFRSLPDHPMRLRTDEARRAWVSNTVKELRRFLRGDMTFLEIGAGDCQLALAVSGLVRNVVAVDVTAELADFRNFPTNVAFHLSDGTSVPVSEASVDFVFSYALMEHVHPDDAIEQLNNIAYALKPGGLYYCITPNKITGPHDISGYFDDEPRGLHLKEYSFSELCSIFKRAGFKTVSFVVAGKGHYVGRLPQSVVVVAENLAAKLPHTFRMCNLGVRIMLGIRALAQR
jgi:SAM-dependent methyltransferase